MDALLSAKSAPLAKPPSSLEQPQQVYVRLAVGQIRPNRYQPRIRLDAEKIKELGQSIRKHGVVEPIVVREIRKMPGQYELIAGERRWRAAQQIGLKQIDAIVRQTDDQQTAVLALIENMDREDLGVLEQAVAMHNLVKQFSLTHEAVAKIVGCSRVNVTNLIRLLELDERVQELLNQDSLQMGHARALLSLPKREQMPAALKIIQAKMTTRQAEKYIQSKLAGTTKKRVKKQPDLTQVERQLSEQLGTDVKVQHKNSGQGKIVISYANLDVFEGIVDKIC